MNLLSKEDLYAITDLSALKIAPMTDGQLHTYRELLSNAANLFPVQKNHLEEALAKMDYAPAMQWLKSIRNSLARIHADEFVQQCEKQLALHTDLENIHHNRLKNFIDFFIAALTILYTDIQLLLEKMEIAEFGKIADKFVIRTRKQLTTISELNEKAIAAIDDNRLDNYVIDLYAFRDTSIEHEDSLRNALRMKIYPSVMHWLSIIEKSLTQIHADDLAGECNRLINLNSELSTIRHDKFELAVNYVMSSLALLRDDIDLLKKGKVL